MEERAGVLDDLAELEVFRTLLEPTGIKGIVVDCPDCDEEHHVDWALMQANLRQLLDEGQTGRHEPPFDPDPDDYVSWDYASGYADGVAAMAEQRRGALTSFAPLVTPVPAQGNEVVPLVETHGCAASC